MKWLSSISLSVISLIVPLLLFAQGVPRIVFDETFVEVGKVKKGEVIKVEFKFRNEGNGILKILSLTPA